jgi:flagellar assembly factor FliW
MLFVTKVRPHRTRSAAADRDRSPLRQTAFCVAGPFILFNLYSECLPRKLWMGLETSTSEGKLFKLHSA